MADVDAVEKRKAKDEDFIRADLVGGLAYFHTAARLHIMYDEVADKGLTRMSEEAHAVVAATAAYADLSIQQVADVFIFGSLDELSSQVESMWTEAVTHLIAFNETFVATNGADQDEASMRKAAGALKSIADAHSHELSDLQLFLVLDYLNDMLGPLAGLDDSYVPDAARFAEALALCNLCRARYAAVEPEPACFNGAASSAMSYYRRVGDEEGIARVMQVGNMHPNASTHWTSPLQTPRVFHSYVPAAERTLDASELHESYWRDAPRQPMRSQPWWPAEDFSAARGLMALFQDEKKRQVLQGELAQVIGLQEGGLRGGDAVANSAHGTGLQRVFTPYIGVRADAPHVNQDGAGAWAEFGPLFAHPQRRPPQRRRATP